MAPGPGRPAIDPDAKYAEPWKFKPTAGQRTSVDHIMRATGQTRAEVIRDLIDEALAARERRRRRQT